MGYGVMTSCFLTTFGIENNDYSYHDTRLIDFHMVKNMR